MHTLGSWVFAISPTKGYEPEGQTLSPHDSIALRLPRLSYALFAEVLCHNCATKPVSAAKIDFVDDLLLLILRNLLKTKRYPEIPAYMARLPFFTSLRTSRLTRRRI